MKLCYHKVHNGKKNFGDDLNPWLWEQLISDVLDDDESTAFVGIGTLLNDNLPNRTRKACKRVIFSTGVGYGKGLPVINDSYKIYCLRGPLSAKALGVSTELAVTDGALLVRQVFKNSNRKLHRFAYMPHHELAGEGWNLVCKQLNFAYIDPGWSTDQILSSISQTEILLTEAMHGAIIADAFRVPWIPVITNPSILQFKWQDWCQSLGVEYRPVYMKRLQHPRKKIDLLSPVRSARDWIRQKKAALELTRIAKHSHPTLSSDTQIEQLTVKLEEKLQQFKNDVKAGYFVF